MREVDELREVSNAYLDVRHMLDDMNYLEPGEYEYRLRPWRWDRDCSVVKAYVAGATLRQITDACEMSPNSSTTIYDILDKYGITRRKTKEN